MYRPPDWLERRFQALKSWRLLGVGAFEAGADAMLEGLKAQGRYCPLHRTFKPPGYKQPIRAPGWVVFIPAETEGDKGGEV